MDRINFSGRFPFTKRLENISVDDIYECVCGYNLDETNGLSELKGVVTHQKDYIIAKVSSIWDDDEKTGMFDFKYTNDSHAYNHAKRGIKTSVFKHFISFNSEIEKVIQFGIGSNPWDGEFLEKYSYPQEHKIFSEKFSWKGMYRTELMADDYKIEQVTVYQWVKPNSFAEKMVEKNIWSELKKL